MLVTSSIPFPPVYWWIQAARSGKVMIDLAEHYQKMSYRNRYYLASPKGKMLMSLPLAQGRNQRVAVKEVRLSQDTDWQGNHWKTIVSLYNRSPFFEYFEYQFRPLFEQPFERLHEFNHAGMQLICRLLKLDLTIENTDTFLKEYPESVTDLRTRLLPQSEPEDMPALRYHQVFSDRTGFESNCSILDLLFCEGMAARKAILG